MSQRSFRNVVESERLLKYTLSVWRELSSWTGREDGDDDDETGYSEDGHGEDEDGTGNRGDGTVSHSKRRQVLSFYCTTGTVKRMESKEDGSLTVTWQVGGHAQYRNIIPMSSGDTQGVSHHLLKYHTDLNVKIRDLKVLPVTVKNPRTLWLERHTHTHTPRHTVTHLPLCHGHTLLNVTDTHQHIDRGFHTYMTSYLAQAYRLSILIDKSTLFINSWLIRLSVDNVLLINTRSL
jgi:hypothetical protein